MPEPIGEFVTERTSGESATDTDSRGPEQSEGGSGQPEILNGFETETPDTEAIGDREPRRTKSGAIDGRSARRGRPRGSRNAEKETSIRLEKIGLEDLLFSLHLMGANILNSPNLALDKEESAKLAGAVQKVASYYSVAFDPKKVALFELAAVCGSIYGPRILAWRIERKTKKQTVARPVTEMPKKDAPAPEPKRAAVSGLYSPSQAFGDMSGEL